MLRDQLELPIDYDAASRGFFCSRPVVQFPSVQISEGELMALFVAQRALEQYRGTAFAKPLRAAFEKLTAALPEQIGFGWEALDGALSFRAGTVGRGTADVEIFRTVSQAVLRREELEFDYRKPALNLKKRLTPPSSFNLERLLEGSFGVFSGLPTE